MWFKRFLGSQRVQNYALIVYGLIYISLYVCFSLEYLDFIVVGLTSVITGALIEFTGQGKILRPLKSALMFFYFISLTLIAYPILNIHGFTQTAFIFSLPFIAAALLALILSLSSLFSK